MKAVKTEHLESLAPGIKVIVGSFGAGKDNRIVELMREPGILIGAWSKLREIKKDGERTGEFELVKDRVVYDAAPDRKVVIGGGLFEIYLDDEKNKAAK